MSALDFFRSPEVEALLERAARAAGTPLSLHYIDRNQEGPKILGWGEAAACQHVATVEGGVRACRQSRQTVSAMAARQGRGMAFVCHMGLACYSLPALPEEQFVLTFGPYCPTEEAKALEYDVQTGYDALTGEENDELPFSLEDIHRTPLTSIPEIAEWTVERLAGVWTDFNAVTEVEPEVEIVEDTSQIARANSGAPVVATDIPAREIALALAGGNQPAAREMLRGILAEIDARPRVRLAVTRARMTAVAGAVLEAAEHAALPTDQAWEAWPKMMQQIETAQNDNALIDAAMQCLGAFRREAAPRRARRTTYAQLNEAIGTHLSERVSLSEAAARLGESPSAVSKRLQRKFGMNYSEYLARLRMEKAKELLRRTQFSAAEVGRRVGIRDQSNFSKVFKKIEGQSPGEYRKRFGRKA